MRLVFAALAAGSIALCGAAYAAPEAVTKLLQLKVGAGADAIAYMAPAEDALPDGPTSIAFGPDGTLLLLDDRQSRIVSTVGGKIEVVADLSNVAYPVRIETVNGILTLLTGGKKFFRLSAPPGLKTLQVSKFDMSDEDAKSVNYLSNPMGDEVTISDDGATGEISFYRPPPSGELRVDLITLVSEDRIVAANMEAFDEKTGSWAVFVQRHRDIAGGSIESRQQIEIYRIEGAFNPAGNKVSKRSEVAVLPADRYGVYDSARVAVRFEGGAPVIAALNPTDDGGVEGGGIALFRVTPSGGKLTTTATTASTSYTQTPMQKSAACKLARALRPPRSTDASNTRLVSPSDALATGHDYASAEWTVDSADNLKNSCAVPCGTKKDPIEGHCGRTNESERVPGGWTIPTYSPSLAAGSKVTGIPYGWGGYDTIGAYRSRLLSKAVWGRYLAGDICTACGGNCNSISAGIDCSGLVGQMFKMGSSKPSTRSLVDKAVEVARDKLLPGDILLKPGDHVATVRSFDKKTGEVEVVESAMGNCRKTARHEGVCEGSWKKAYAERYTPMRLVKLTGFPLAQLCAD